MVYKQVKLELTQAQQRKLAAGKSVQLTKAQINSDTHSLYVHPANYDKIMKARKKGTGCRINIERGEIDHDLNNMKGGSIWDWIKKGFKWLKDSGVASTIADAAVPALATAVGAPQLGSVARSGLKSLTGVGIRGGKVARGSQEAKDRMAALRAMRKDKKLTPSGSFRLN
jgi:hypothetical protein